MPPTIRAQSALAVHVAKRVNPTGQARMATLKVFTSAGKINRTLLRKLDGNPLSYKLPNEFVYINDTNTIERASEWLDINYSTDERTMRATFEDEYELVGNNFIQTKWGNQQMASTYSFGAMVATFNSPIKNKLAFDSVGREVFQRFKKKFKEQINLHRGIRFHFAFEVEFKSSRGNPIPPFWISVDSDRITDIRNFPRIVNEGIRDIKHKITELQKKGSGWIFVKAQHVSANVLKYNPTRGGSYLPTPPKLKNAKYGLVNVINKKEKDRCFVDAILACIHYDDLETPNQKKHRSRSTMYKEWKDELDISMFKAFPVEANSRRIDKFERKNDISVNIYQYTEGHVYILKQSTLPPPLTEGTPRRCANLLLISNADNSIHHYVAASNMSALLCKQIGKHNAKTYPCQYCLHHYTSKEAHDNHQKFCSQHEAIATEMPEPGSMMKFKNNFHQVKASGVINADFESFNMKVSGCMPATNSFTQKIAEQTPNSYMLLGICVNGKQFKRIHNITEEEARKEISVGDLVVKYKSGLEYTVEDIKVANEKTRYTIKGKEETVEVSSVDIYKVNMFMKQFFNDLTYIENMMRKEFQSKKDIKHMIMSEVEKVEHTQASKCYLCEAKFCSNVKDVVLPAEETTGLKEEMKKGGKTDKEIRKAIAALKIQRFNELKKVRDHNHCTGDYIGAACSKCNINRNEQYFKIPVVFHNLKGYDSKFIIRECVEMTKRFMVEKRTKLEPLITQAEQDLKDVYAEINHLEHISDTDENYRQHLRRKEFDAIKEVTNLKRRLSKLPRVDVIPLNSEKYLSFGCGGLRFIDSMSFMATGLDKLVKNPPDAKKQLTTGYFSKKYKGGDISLLMKKGVYPYSWVDSREKFQQTTLPERDAFYNDIDEKACSKKDYKHAQKVWTEFECQTFEDYSNLYLECDVFLLADVFEAFRDLMLDTHKLDPAFYFSPPQLSWDAMLKMTKINLELLSDQDIYLMIESGIRGGVSFISHRKGVANNKYMKTYDKKKPSKYITYFDVNNLYGFEMMKAMAYKDFKIADPSGFKVTESHEENLEMVEKLVACKDPDKDHTGYIMEVDIDYPENLHDLHNAYPLLPENTNIDKSCYSEYHKSCFQTCESCVKAKERKEGCNQCIPVSKVKKLIPTLRNKRNYVLDVRLLHCAMKHGLHLKKIHRVVQFTQKAWLKVYIEHNSKLRAQATNEFEKDFYKLLNNAVFGKTMENLRNRMDFEIVTDEGGMDKASRNPRLRMPLHHFGHDCVGVEYSKKKIKLCKPIYCGLQILDMSKTTMYEFHYERMMKAYGPERVKMLFTDTDSFAYEIETDDVYADMQHLEEFKVGNDGNTIFDTSNYPKDHPLFSTANKKVPGYMKDEASGKIITSFVGLRAKMYSYETMTPDEQGEVHKKTHKGIKKKMDIPHSEYEDCLQTQKCNYKEWNCIRSKKHEMFVMRIKKKALSAMDDKSYILDDGISSLKWGHKDIPPERNIAGSSNNADC